MTSEEIEKLSEAIGNTLGTELIPKIKELIKNVYQNKPLSLGINDSYEFLVKKVKFNPLMMFDDTEDQSVLSYEYKPEKFLENDNDYYFPIKELIVFNEYESYFGVIGNKWFVNDIGDEFVEAIVFGDHYVCSVDCVLGSVQVNSPFGVMNYIGPGALVSLKVVKFKNTNYLLVTNVISRLFIQNENDCCWNVGKTEDVYTWDGEDYVSDDFS